MLRLPRYLPHLLLALALVAALLPRTGEAAKTRLTFSGGPDGGTFQVFAQAMSKQLSQAQTIAVSDIASAGSVENIFRIQSGDADFAIAYAGDAFLARTGNMPKDSRQYKNLRALAYLYGAPAHLVTLADSGIDDLTDLKGKRVAVGGAGSGAAAAAQRYFGTLGLWEFMKVDYIGYSKAASALAEGRIDAFWVFSGVPNTAVKQAAAGSKIKILDTWQSGTAEGFFEDYPFYSAVTIPAGTYRGIDAPVQTFQDSALWVAGKHVSPQNVRTALERIFSPEGLAAMPALESSAAAMSVERALITIAPPVHEGAAQFWNARSLDRRNVKRTDNPSGKRLPPSQ